jgi:hypothetical protein
MHRSPRCKDFGNRRLTTDAIPPCLAIALLAVVGCSQNAAQPGAIERDAQSQSAAPSKSAANPTLAAKETWDVYYIQGVRAGYGRIVEREVDDEGRTLLRFEGEQKLSIQRFGEATEVGFEISSLETPEGKLLSLSSKREMGPQPTTVSGWVQDDKLHLSTTTAGKTVESQIDWPAEARGYFAIEQELARKPMQPGEHRTFEGLEPIANTLGQIDLLAGDYEVAELLAGSYELLRIESTVEQLGEKLSETLWVDRSGAVLKGHFPVMQISRYRTTKAVALAEPDEMFDLGDASTVKLAKPLKNAHESKHAVYRVELSGGDPAAVFVAGPGQRVKSTGPNSAEITVDALRPDALRPDALRPDAPSPEGQAELAAPPTAADRQPSSFIQSDDPAIIAMAEKAAGDEQDPWKVAASLESYVHRNLAAKNYSTAFATASEVAQSMEGDCTEHAVLLAALARARKLPARVAIGLVYAAKEQGFAFHLWTEVYVNRRWIPLDATLGRGGAGADHLKLADSSLEGDAAYASFLPVAQVLGRLKIEALEME